MEGKRNGKGNLKEANGGNYEGEFINNEKNGHGTYEFKGKKYVGSFRDGHFWGQGTLDHGNGDVYTGEFVKDKKEGIGKMQIKRLNEAYEG